jgi:hypothetical protein
VLNSIFKKIVSIKVSDIPEELVEGAACASGEEGGHSGSARRGSSSSSSSSRSKTHRNKVNRKKDKSIRESFNNMDEGESLAWEDEMRTYEEDVDDDERDVPTAAVLQELSDY